jgi:hypothetical protein
VRNTSSICTRRPVVAVEWSYTTRVTRNPASATKNRPGSAANSNPDGGQLSARGTCPGQDSVARVGGEGVAGNLDRRDVGTGSI